MRGRSEGRGVFMLDLCLLRHGFEEVLGTRWAIGTKMPLTEKGIDQAQGGVVRRW